MMQRKISCEPKLLDSMTLPGGRDYLDFFDFIDWVNLGYEARKKLFEGADAETFGIEFLWRTTSL